MRKLILPLLFLAMSLPLFAQTTTMFTNGPSATTNGNHSAGCPVQLTSQDGQVVAPNTSAICFQASFFNNSGYCSNPDGSVGYCISIAFPATTLGTSGLFESGVITYGPMILTSGNGGIGSTFSQDSTINFWGQFTGTLHENFLRRNTYQSCSRRCVIYFNDVITGGSGTLQQVTH